MKNVSPGSQQSGLGRSGHKPTAWTQARNLQFIGWNIMCYTYQAGSQSARIDCYGRRFICECMCDLLRRQWHEFRLNLRPREFAYWFVQNLILLFCKLFIQTQLFGGEHYAPPAPATLLLCGHKRDWDPLLCAPRLYYQRGWWRPDSRRMAFVGREDMFLRGFMAEIVDSWEWPRWAMRLLDLTNLTPIVRPLRAYPIARALEYSLRSLLFDVYQQQGNLPLQEVLSEEMLDHLDRWATETASRQRRFKPRPSRQLHVKDILTWDYREPLMQNLRRRFLVPEQYAWYQARQRAKIEAQLQALGAVLRRGDTLWIAPEGMITPDGAQHRVRGGIAALLALAPPKTRVLPVNITYDFMTTGRMRACLSVGAPLEGLADLPRAELSARVLHALARQIVVTMTLLGSRFLWERLQQGQPDFDEAALSTAVAQNMRLLRQQGAAFEQGLQKDRTLQRRLRAFITYGLRSGLLIRLPGKQYRINPAPFQQRRETFFWLNPRYCVNELLTLEAALTHGERSIATTPG